MSQLGAFGKLRDNNTSQNQEAYFNAFPNTWPEFLDLCRALDSLDNQPQGVCDYVEALGNLTAINDTAYCVKLLNLTIGADLDADGPNWFHGLLHKQMGCVASGCSYGKGDTKGENARLNTMLHLLSKIAKGDRMRFWQFYWSSLQHEADGSVPGNLHAAELSRLQKIATKEYPEQQEPIIICYKYFQDGVYFMSDYPYSNGFFGIAQ